MIGDLTVQVLDQLDQDPPGAAGVQEGHPVPAGSGTRPSVDELDASTPKALEVGLEVGGTVGDVVQARSASGEKAADRAVGAQGLEELYGPQEAHPDALGFQGLGRGGRLPRKRLEEAGGVFQGSDGYGDVIEIAGAFSEDIHGRVRVTRRAEMATTNAILEVNDDNFATAVEGNQSLTMVDFWAVWCGPCRLVAPIVEDLASEYGPKGLKVAKMDVDANPSTPSRYGIRSIPTILFFKGGRLVDQVIGFVPRPHLEEKIKKHL